MKANSAKFPFFFVYEKADLVESCVFQDMHFKEIDWEDSRAIHCLTRYPKVSILEHYAFYVITVESRRYYRENADLMGLNEFKKILDWFAHYRIQCSSPPSEFTQLTESEFGPQTADRFYG